MRHVVLLALVMLALAGGTSARAQTAPAPATAPAADTLPEVGASPPTLMLHQNAATHPEQVLMMFEKAAGNTPDFQAWAQQSPFLKNAAALDRDAVISRESNRLREQWTQLDATRPLVVHTRISLSNYSTVQEKFFIPDFTAQTFFAYSLYGRNVAIIPQDIAKFGAIPMAQAEMDDMLKKARNTGGTVELILEPVQVDAKTPFRRNNTDYWLMLAKIDEIRIWGGLAEKPELLWMQRAPGYVPRQDPSLMDLKPAMP